MIGITSDRAATAGTASLRAWWRQDAARGAGGGRAGGDWIDLVELPDGRLGLTMGDASGHDDQAWALAGVLRDVIRHWLLAGSEPDEVLRRALDEVAVLGNMGEMFATAVVVLIDPASGRLTYANAGHPPPVLMPGAGGGAASRQLDATGPILSDLFAGSRLWSSRSVILAPDDRLLLYTDGLTEARINRRRDRYDEDALRRFVADLAPAQAPDVVRALVDLLAGFGDGIDDDVAILAIGIPPRRSSTAYPSV
jgi:serine phosphatase RsbU (regulator of sigma subunit)